MAADITGHFNLNTDNPNLACTVWWSIHDYGVTAGSSGGGGKTAYAKMNVEVVLSGTGSASSGYYWLNLNNRTYDGYIPAWSIYDDSFHILDVHDISVSYGFLDNLSRTCHFTFSSDAVWVPTQENFISLPDIAPPWVDLTGVRAASSSSISFTATPQGQCNSWQYQVDGGSWKTFKSGTASSATYTITGLSSAVHSINIAAKAVRNNVWGYSGTLRNIDLVAPTVTFNASVSAVGSIAITAYSNVIANSWQYRIDGGSWITFSTVEATSQNYTITGLSNASHTIQVQAKKKSNALYGTATTKTVDLALPTVTVNLRNATTNGFTISATSNVACNTWEYKLDNGNWISFSTTSGTSASKVIEGLGTNTTHTVQVRAKKTSNGLYGTSSSASITTIGGLVKYKVNGAWKNATVYTKVNGEWKQAIAYVKVDGAWKMGV